MKSKKRIMSLPLLLMGVFLVFAISCDELDNYLRQENVPVLSTAEVTEITANSAISGGNITDDGETTLTARGVCWSTNENPTIEDNKTEDGPGAGSFKSIVTDLEPNTTYYLRAYATNSAGTGYGNAMSFTTEGEEWNESTFTDPRDGKVYKTVTNGNHEWMAENLAYAPSSGNYWAYDNDDANVEVYGYLYDWQTALNVCPKGWHLPTDKEWTELSDYLGGWSSGAGGKLKATGTIDAGTGFWRDPNTGATNETGFTALPGGLRGSQSCGWGFGHIGSIGYWWSATEYDSDDAWFQVMGFNHNSVDRSKAKKEHGFSVRCLRD